MEQHVLDVSTGHVPAVRELVLSSGLQCRYLCWIAELLVAEAVVPVVRTMLHAIRVVTMVIFHFVNRVVRSSSHDVPNRVLRTLT